MLRLKNKNQIISFIDEAKDIVENTINFQFKKRGFSNLGMEGTFLI